MYKLPICSECDDVMVFDDHVEDEGKKAEYWECLNCGKGGYFFIQVSIKATKENLKVGSKVTRQENWDPMIWGIVEEISDNPKVTNCLIKWNDTKCLGVDQISTLWLWKEIETTPTE